MGLYESGRPGKSAPSGPRLLMSKIDHHVHTSRHSPDSVIEPDDLVAEARLAGLDGVVITEHDYQWAAEELAELQARAGRLLVLSGAEISTRQGHFLVYGLPNLDGASPGIDVKDLIAYVRRHDAAIVAAHPFRWEQDFDAIIAECGPNFDALELVSNNITPQTRALTERVASRHSLGTTGSSDGHEPSVVGCYYTSFPAPILSMGDFVRALRSRSGSPGHTAGRRRTSGPVD
ncbi:MAG: putative metal-dependent phosphoesterase, family [Planctomycetota bacterium]|nr:putative metal-dependent phosphoesterase, family [Planctomycetota bacterium]